MQLTNYIQDSTLKKELVYALIVERSKSSNNLGRGCGDLSSNLGRGMFFRDGDLCWSHIVCFNTCLLITILIFWKYKKTNMTILLKVCNRSFLQLNYIFFGLLQFHFIFSMIQQFVTIQLSTTLHNHWNWSTPVLFLFLFLVSHQANLKTQKALNYG